LANAQVSTGEETPPAIAVYSPHSHGLTVELIMPHAHANLFLSLSEQDNRTNNCGIVLEAINDDDIDDVLMTRSDKIPCRSHLRYAYSCVMHKAEQEDLGFVEWEQRMLQQESCRF